MQFLRLCIQYIIEETALSICMTEIRDHSVEIYRRGMGFVDYLYAGHAEAVRSWTGKKVLNRKFVSIEQWVQRKGGHETIAPDLAATDCQRVYRGTFRRENPYRDPRAAYRSKPFPFLPYVQAIFRNDGAPLPDKLPDRTGQDLAGKF